MQKKCRWFGRREDPTSARVWDRQRVIGEEDNLGKGWQCYDKSCCLDLLTGCAEMLNY